MAWLTGWSNRIPLTIDGVTAGLAGALSNRDVAFAVPAALKAIAQANGEDLRITQSDGVTLEPYGIEDWSAANPVVHFNATTISPLQVVYYIYTGNAGAPDAQAKASVMDGNTEAYFPMSDAASPADDWTSNGFDAVDQGAAIFGATGKIADAVEFDKTVNSWLEIPVGINAAIPGDNVTVEAWVNADTFAETSSNRGIVTCGFNITATIKFQLGISVNIGVGNELGCGFYSSGSWKFINEGADLTQNAWIHVAGTYDGDVLRLYRAGGPVANSASLSTALPASSDPWRIGRRHDLGTAAALWDGEIDHVIISSVRRSVDWIAFSAENYPGSGMFAFGALETVPAGAPLFQPVVIGAL